MRVARNARCGFRSSPARESLIGTIVISGIELSCGKHSIKQFSNRDKTRLLTAPKRNVFAGISTPAFARPQIHEVTLSHYCARLFARAQPEC
jgi:hypothetical protein